VNGYNCSEQFTTKTMAFLREIRSGYWALLESYRDGAGKPRQRSLKTWAQGPRPTQEQVALVTSCKVRPIVSYTGSKWQLAEREGGIADLLLSVEWKRYLEPFCGSAGVWGALWNRGAFQGGRDARLNDASGDLVTLYRVARRPGLRRALVDALEAWEFSQADLALAVAVPEDDEVTRAAKLLVRQWQSRSPEKEGSAPGSGYAPGESRKRVWEGLPDRLETFGKALRASADIYQVSAFRWLRSQARSAGGDCAIYADPPYIEREALYESGAGWDEATHKKLAAILADIPAKAVAVSYYPHPLVERLYPRESWVWHEFEVRASARGNGHHRRTELVLLRR
jgi:site-specific DNA-adenine methylase